MIPPDLKEESERLARSWMRHQSDWLRDYLVAGVEDPRLNIQSILSRHFLLRALTGERFAALMKYECRFGAVMTWLTTLAAQAADPDTLAGILHALRHGADNAEGIPIPPHILHTFALLPAAIGDITVPNYLESFLTGASFAEGQPKPHQPSLETFQHLWTQTLSRSTLPRTHAPRSATPPTPRLSVLEPACGSANDYRSLAACGLAPLLDYTGFDLCAKNIANARALFPGVRFELGNVFAIPAPDLAFDLCFVHDLLEHLSPTGLQAAVKEICRVTRRAICVGFFNMDEIPEHVVRPVEEYHWNTLSMARTRELFATHGFVAQIIHIGTFLRQTIGSAQTHNPNAYTFLLYPNPLLMPQLPLAGGQMVVEHQL